MNFIGTEIPNCYIIELNKLEDERGWFARTFCANLAEPYIGKVQFVQMNHSYNAKKGTFRGMHYQVPPNEEAKLIRCISGAAIDYILDLRLESTTFLKWISVEISKRNQRMVFLPPGIAHGFQTIEDNTELLYHHTAFYHKESDRGIRYNDPMLNIQPTLPISIISDKDLNYPFLPPNFNGIML